MGEEGDVIERESKCATNPQLLKKIDQPKYYRGRWTDRKAKEHTDTNTYRIAL